MKRRSFLAMLGLAPAVGVISHLPAIAKEASATARVSAKASAYARAIYAMETSLHGSYRSTGLFIDVDSTGTRRAMLDADQFVIGPTEDVFSAASAIAC